MVDQPHHRRGDVPAQPHGPGSGRGVRAVERTAGRAVGRAVGREVGKEVVRRLLRAVA